MVGGHANATSVVELQEEGRLTQREALLTRKVFVLVAAVVAFLNVTPLRALLAFVSLAEVGPFWANNRDACEVLLGGAVGARVQASVFVDDVFVIAKSTGVIGHDKEREGQVVEVAPTFDRSHCKRCAVVFGSEGKSRVSLDD